MSSTALRSSRPLRRDWSSGLRSLLRFMRQRGGLADALEGMFALAGPMLEREFRAFAAHPVGRPPHAGPGLTGTLSLERE